MLGGKEGLVGIEKSIVDQNVYLLSEVTENDLLGLAKPSEEVVQEEPADASIFAPKPEPEPQPEPSNSSGSSSGMLFLIIALLGAGGAGYYFKIYKPKHDNDDGGYDEEDEMNADENEEYIEEPSEMDMEEDEYDDSEEENGNAGENDEVKKP